MEHGTQAEQSWFAEDMPLVKGSPDIGTGLF